MKRIVREAAVMLASLASLAWGQAPQVSIVGPAADGSTVDSVFFVNATVNAPGGITNVVAVVGPVSVDLKPALACRLVRGFTFCDPSWGAYLDFSGLPPGPQTVVVTARDATGNTTSAVRTVVHDWLRIASPIARGATPTAVARPHLAIVADCGYEIPAGCSSLTASVRRAVPGEPLGPVELVASGTHELNTVVDLSAYEGSTTQLFILATYPDGKTRGKTITVYVEGGSVLQEEAVVPGTIADVDAGRVLYSGYVSDLVIRDRGTGNDTTLYSTLTRRIFGGWLTPVGAAFSLQNLNFIGAYTLMSVETGIAKEIGYWDSLVQNVPPRSGGAYLSWPNLDGASLLRRDVVAGSTVTIAASGVPTDVAPNGAVTFSTYNFNSGTYFISISLYRADGTTELITPDGPSSQVFRALTDGDGVLFVKIDNPQQSPPPARLMLARGGLQQELVPAPLPGGYAIRNGWVAYTKRDPAGVSQVWRMDAAGVVTQLTSGSGSGLIDLAEDGSIVFEASSKLHFLAMGSTTAVAFPQSGTLRFVGAAPQVYLGGSLFSVNTVAKLLPQPAALAFAGHDMGTTAPARSFTFTNTGSSPVTVGTVAATGDFAVASNNCATVAPGATCTIGVTFTATATGERTGKLIIDGAGVQQVRRLTGVGRAVDRFTNVSTRLNVLTGEDLLIGGFVVGGSGTKRVAIVATGFSLSLYGIANPLGNPTLTLVRSSDQAVVATNDDWESAPNKADLVAAGLAPAHYLEAAILVDLPPGAYTAIVKGADGGTGISVIGVYEVGGDTIPLVNISTRGRVEGGDNVMIGGFNVTGGTYQTVAIVATGPSLSAFGIANPLVNPKVTLVRSSDQAVIATNDDWQTDTNAVRLQAAGFAPSNPVEAALLVTLQPGAYTAIVEGASFGPGVAVIGIYRVN